MLFSLDMKDLLGLFESHGVRYVLVGGYAVNYYGYVRTTQDIDLLVFPSKKNADRILGALDAFGFGGAGIPGEIFERPGSAVHLGVEPNRIDLLTHLKGLDNDSIFEHSKKIEMEGVGLRIISFDHLIVVKKASDRARDLADVEELLAARRD